MNSTEKARLYWGDNLLAKPSLNDDAVVRLLDAGRL